MSTFVVAGATGRVGSVVASALLDAGERVIVVSRDAARCAGWAARGAIVAQGPLGDAAFLGRTLGGAAGLFTLLPEDVDMLDFHGERQRIADAIASAVASSGAPRVVMLSTTGADQAVNNGPARGLHHLEAALRTTGAAVTALRAATFQDNLAAMLAPARATGAYPHFMPSHDTAIPMVATRDVGTVAAAELRAPARGSDVLDVLGPAYSPADVARQLGETVGRTVIPVAVPAGRREAALVEAGLPRPLAAAVLELLGAVAAGLVRPRGDRRVVGATTLGETLRGALPSRAPTGAPTGSGSGDGRR